MDWQGLTNVIVQLAIFSLYVTSIIEVVKAISAASLKTLVVDLWNTLVLNKPMASASFPMLNFLIALLCAWAFNVTIMQVIFHGVLNLQLNESTAAQKWVAQHLDYFGTASLTYAGSDQLFKRFLAVSKEAKEVVSEVQK